jgi:hypothetical protein
MRLKTFYTAKETITRVKRNPQNGSSGDLGLNPKYIKN